MLFEHKWLLNFLYGISFLKSPWLLTGDFNVIFDREEHKGGSFYSFKLNFFSTFIFENSLFDLGFISPCITWSND